MITNQPLSVLVVDDDPRWRALVAETLRDAGWSVTALGQPPAELSGLQLAVLDIELGSGAPHRRAGLRLLDQLAGVRTRCVVLTGIDDAELAAEVMRRPHVLGLLRKDSFRREELLALVQQLSAPPQVLIIEDDQRWRAIYADVLSEEGYQAQSASSYGEARGWLQRARFALAIVDLQLTSSADRQDNRDGFRLLQAARQRGVPAIVVSALGDPEDIDMAYDEYGVFAFVEKEAFDRRVFARTVADAIRGSQPVSPVPGPAPAALAELTDRERDVLALLTQGFTNRQIAAALLITPNTVKKHVDHILQKLAVSNRAGAVAAALKAGSPGLKNIDM
jgi:DNA-binding NarL/FixJ family response regulator